MTAEALYLALLDRGLRLRVDDDDRLIVSPGDRLTPRDRVEIKRHRDELLSIVSFQADDTGDDEADTGPAPERTGLPVPSGCVGPRACRVLGVCDRQACRLAGDISIPSLTEEVAA